MNTYSVKSKFAFSSVLLLSLVACGGGDDSEGTSSGGNTSTNELMQRYTGSTAPASLTEEDVYPVLQYLFKGDASGFSSASGSSFLRSAEIQSKLQTRRNSTNETSRATESYSCSDGGTLVLKENLNASNLGQVSVEYKQCDEGGIIYSGSLMYDYLTMNNGEFEAFTIIYDNYKETYRYWDNTYTKLTGNITFTGMDTCQKVATSNLLLDVTLYDLDVAAATDEVSVLEVDLKSEIDTCSYIKNADNTKILSGRMYFSNMGYVDIKTDTPISLDSNNNSLIAGKFHLTNELSTLTLETIAGTGIYDDTSMTIISIDEDNDANTDREIAIQSWNLLYEKYSDFTDEDTDGILDLWEADNGLDPTVSNENIDSDNDGFLDYHEYLAGTDPLLSYSTPTISIAVSYNESDYSAIYVGDMIDIPVVLTSSLTGSHIIERMNPTLTIPLTPAHTWSLIENDSNCEILNDTETDTPILSCSQLNIASPDNESIIATLQVTLNDETPIELPIQLVTDSPNASIDSELLSINLDVL